MPIPQSSYDARLHKRIRKILLVFVAFVVLTTGWIVWNQPRRSDMARYVPAEALAFIEVNDPAAATKRITETEAWRALAPPLEAPAELIPRRWLIGFARWTGIGSNEAVLLARSQVALFFAQAQAQASESENTLTIKPLAALIIETHTSQRRMRAPIEKQVAQFAERAYDHAILTRKQVGDVELIEWTSSDNTRRLVLGFIDTSAIIGNDETVVMSSVEVRRGTRNSLADNAQLATTRQALDAANSDVFAFVPKPGVKAAIQAWAFSRAGNFADAASIAPILSNAFGNLIDSLALATRFDGRGAEDRCRVFLTKNVGKQLAASTIPEPSGSGPDSSFAPAAASSVTAYQFRNPAGFWRELNAAISAHADVIGAIASKPLLRSLLEPYGVTDPDRFFTAIGPRIELIRTEHNAPAVLVAETLDMPTLRALAERRLGNNRKSEQLDQAELLVGADGWSVAFINNYFLSGPVDQLRRCLEAKNGGEALTSVPAFSRAEQSIDFSLPIIALTISDDRAAAISFVELFSQHERSAFSTSAPAVQQAASSLNYHASVTTLQDDSFQWTSRSSFGIVGSLFTTVAPERSR